MVPAPVLIIFAIVVFYTGLWVLNIPFEYASDMGIVLRPGPVRRSFALNLLAYVGPTDLYAVLSQKWTMIMILLVSLAALLLNSSSLELILKNQVTPLR